jgi:long-chain acyl-CoA synthetase
MLAHTILLTERLDQLAATTPLATAVVDPAKALTYADLRYQAALLALALRRRGVRPIDRVALILPNHVDLVVALFACFRLGAVAVPLHPRCPPEERERVFRDCEPCLALVERAASPGAPGGEVPALALGELRSPERPVAPHAAESTGEVRPAPEDLAVLIYTSGTTARPKGVMHLHGRVARAAERRAAWLGIAPADRVASLATLAHALGLMGGLFPAVSAGATLLLPPLDDPAGMARFLARHRATLALGTPWIYASLATLPGQPHDLASLRHCYSGGDTLTETVLQAFASRYGVEIRQMCGMTELPGYCAVPAHAANRPGSIGLPQPGIELRLVAVETDGETDGLLPPGSFREPDPVPSGEVGEIWVRSDVATVGYWNNPAATAALLRDGWIRTGDLAWADEDGYLYFVGRRAPARRGA